MQDSYVHKGKRKILIDYLRDKMGIADEKVLAAINKVPRHLFLVLYFNYAVTATNFCAVACTVSKPSSIIVAVFA